MSLLLLPLDAMEVIFCFLDTCDLLCVDIVHRVPSTTWNSEVRQRCGSMWPLGKQGLRRMYEAASLCCSVRCCTSVHWLVSTGIDSAHSVDALGVWKWHAGTRLVASLDTLSVTSLCSVNKNCVAVGHSYGVCIFVEEASGAFCSRPLYTGVSVTDIASVGIDTLWLVTAQHHAYSWSMSSDFLQPICAGIPVYCVSGPCAAAGTLHGVWPLQGMLQEKCGCIQQSATLLAALYNNGFVGTFDTHTLQSLHLFDANPRVNTLSVVCDIVCVDGFIWTRGRCRGYCRYDVQRVTHDGRVLMVSQATSATLAISQI